MTTLTMKDEKPLEIIHRVFRSELTVSQAALVLGISERRVVSASDYLGHG
jgi:DNA-directed RNA polymerase specialized sigma subunit